MFADNIDFMQEIDLASPDTFQVGQKVKVISDEGREGIVYTVITINNITSVVVKFDERDYGMYRASKIEHL